MEAYRLEVSEIVANVFGTMLGEMPQPVNEVWTAEPGRLSAAVFFAGEWKGAALVECSEEMARYWTSKLMSIEVPDEFGDDVEDTLGEIVNMVGGNLKSVLPRGVGLSMPIVVHGKNYSMRICGGNMTSRQSFQTSRGVFWVTLVEVLEK